MVLRQSLTPEALLSAPRRSPAVPSPSGTLAYLTVSTHTFAAGGAVKGTTAKEVLLLDLDSGTHWPLAVPGNVDKIQEMSWIPSAGSSGGPDELLWLRAAAEPAGATEVVVGTVPTHAGVDAANFSPYVAAVIPAPVKALKLKALPDGAVAFAVAGLVGADGRLHNSKAEVTAGGSASASASVPGSTARIYDTWQVREWDTYLAPQRYGIWHGLLQRKGKAKAVATEEAAAPGKWTLSPLHNALRNAPHLEAPASIYEPGDAADDYDVGLAGVVFVGREPAPADPVTAGCSAVYYVPLDSFGEATAFAPAAVAVTPSLSASGLPPLNAAATAAATAGFGQCAHPRFSPDGSLVAFLRSPLACPADVRLHVGDVGSGAAVDVATIIAGGRDFRSGLDLLGIAYSPPAFSVIPDAFEFAPSGHAVLLAAPDCGRRRLFSLALRPGARPRPISRPHGSVAAFYIARSDAAWSSFSLLVSGSSFVESSFYHMYEVEDDSRSLFADDVDSSNPFFEPRLVAASKEPARFGLSHAAQVSELYFDGGGSSSGDDGYCVQAWVVRPSFFDPARKYPLALLVHGGPESAWADEWHLRWNAAAWAEQGFVVVMPNITGSTGFGLEHTTRIYGSWGGYPYEDLVKCMQSLREVPYIDTSRAIVAGGSYGGYMVNWILGNALGKEFKAAVTHDSVFTTTLMDLTSDAADGEASFRGPPFLWKNYDGLDRWNPARPDLLARWRTHAPPTLVIHSDRDFRCPVTEGIAVFRALQFQGVPSRLLTFPDENHFVLNADNALAWHRTVFGWVKQWTV